MPRNAVKATNMSRDSVTDSPHVTCETESVTALTHVTCECHCLNTCHVWVSLP